MGAVSLLRFVAITHASHFCCLAKFVQAEIESEGSREGAEGVL